ncbi:MAG: cytochrome c [Chitinophagaceae bacterium]|nr:cytochrome c [Chitinophagaceae bacterium]
MKKMLLISGLFLLVLACSTQPETKKETTDSTPPAPAVSADDKRGIGKFTNVEIGKALDSKMAELGTKVYEVKCSSCHKLTDEKLVGPGWKDVTQRRSAEWVMNFATNTEEMLEKDANAQAMLELCLVRMPNQSLTDDDARHVYEFMRKNDGVK